MRGIVCEQCVIVQQGQGHTSKKMWLVESSKPSAQLTFTHFSGNWLGASLLGRWESKERQHWDFLSPVCKKRITFTWWEDQRTNSLSCSFRALRISDFTTYPSDRNPFALSLFSFLSFLIPSVPPRAFCFHQWIPCLPPQGAVSLPFFSFLFSLTSHTFWLQFWVHFQHCPRWVNMGVCDTLLLNAQESRLLPKDRPRCSPKAQFCFFGRGQKFPVNLLKWEGGNWLVQLSQEAGGRRFTLVSRSSTIRVHLTIVLLAPQGTLSFCYQTTELNYLKSQKMHFGELLCEFCFAVWSPEGPMRTIALLCDSEHLPKHV